jgi:hypothetical protein
MDKFPAAGEHPGHVAWVQERRMIRVTTRIERGSRVVSVSLVDGVILDNLGGG